MYLGIFESEMTHVVIDQTKGKAPVHECQAPLKREKENWLAHIHAKKYAIYVIPDKTNI